MSAAQDDWDRSWFASGGSELAFHEAVRALERVLEQPELSRGLRLSVEQTWAALRCHLDEAADPGDRG